MEWISVKDRLPQTYTYVLICNFDFESFMKSESNEWHVNEFSIARFDGKNWESVYYHPGAPGYIITAFAGDCTRYIGEEDITHWAYPVFTKPPKE